MTRQWNDSIVVAALGVLSVGAVLLISQLFKTPTPSEKNAEAEVRSIANLKRETDVRFQVVANKLDELQSAVRKLEQRIAASDSTGLGLQSREPPAADPRVAPVGPSKATGAPPIGKDSVQVALDRGLQYVARHEYDASEHNRVRSDLIAAYMQKGLPEETNTALLAMIQQVNEIGLTNVLSEARRLPPSEMNLRIRDFLRDTPRLTRRQIARLNEVIAQSPDRK